MIKIKESLRVVVVVFFNILFDFLLRVMRHAENEQEYFELNRKKEPTFLYKKLNCTQRFIPVSPYI